MTRDPIIAELRAFRDQYARKHGYSMRAIAEDLKGFRIPKSIAHAKPTRPAKKIAL